MADGKIDFCGTGHMVDGEDMAEIVLQIIKSSGIRVKDTDGRIIRKLAREFEVEKKLLPKPLSSKEMLKKMITRCDRLHKRLQKRRGKK